MQLEDIRIILAGAEPYNTLQSAINAAVSRGNTAVVIPAWYAGTDTYTNASNIPVVDYRPASTNQGSNLPIGRNGVTAGIKAVGAAAAPITAAAGGVFTSVLDAPGYSVLEGVVFKVKATGWTTFPAGTYTATVQPLIYASTSLGYTASAAAAIVSAAAISMTIASATAATHAIWETEVELSGDSTTGVLAGVSGGRMVDANALETLVTPAIIVRANTPSGINFASATAPIEFLTGVTLGAGAPATSVINLNKFYIES